MDIAIDGKTYGQTDRWSERQVDREKGGQRQMERQTVGQRGTLTQTRRHIHTHHHNKNLEAHIILTCFH